MKPRLCSFLKECAAYEIPEKDILGVQIYGIDFTPYRLNPETFLEDEISCRFNIRYEIEYDFIRRKMTLPVLYNFNEMIPSEGEINDLVLLTKDIIKE